MDHPTPFAQTLKQRRKALDLTQQALAERVGCARVTIQRIEQGTLRPSRQIAERLAEIFGLPGGERAAFVRLARGGDSQAEEVPTSGLAPATPTLHRSLPTPLTPLIGRSREVAVICQALEDPGVRLVTLVGPGGIGKTRVAIQAAGEMEEAYRNSIVFVDLAPITDSNLVVTTIAQTLRIDDHGGQPILTTLKHYLHNKHILLVLDNVEQVAAAASDIAALLQAAPQVKVLMTSRIVVGVYGEQLIEVPPLHFPDASQLPPLTQLVEYDAIRLFMQRAQAMQVAFVLTNDNATAVTVICQRLDGLPLAIELAAARVRVLSPQQLLARLDQRLPLLTGGARTLPTRQQTLRATLDWSYHLLDLHEQTLFRRLGVFVGGYTLEAAEAICSLDGDLSIDVVNNMAALVDHSLVQQKDQEGEEPRFVMLETIREYALELLAASCEVNKLRANHAAYYLAFAEAAELELRGPREHWWFQQLERDLGNIRAALRWLLDSGDSDRAVSLMLHVSSYWETRSHYTEARRWFAEALAPGRNLSSLKYALGLCMAAYFATQSGEFEEATVQAEASLPLFRELGNSNDLISGLCTLGISTLHQGKYDRASSVLEECVQIARALNATGRLQGCLHVLGEVALYQGAYDRAVALATESIAVTRSLENQRFLIYSLDSCARALLARGDLQQAISLWTEGLRRAYDTHEQRAIVYYIEGFASAAAHQCSPRRAARLAGAASAVRQEIASPLSAPEAALLERFLTPAREQLTQADWVREWQAGRGMTLEQAITYALS